MPKRHFLKCTTNSMMGMLYDECKKDGLLHGQFKDTLHNRDPGIKYAPIPLPSQRRKQSGKGWVQALWHILVPEALSRGVTFAAALAADLLQGLGPSDLEVPKNGVTRGPGRAGPPQGTRACPKQAASLLGLGQLLRCVPPSRQLLDALWGLDARLQGFVASVLSAWQAMSSAWVAWAGNGKGTNGAVPCRTPSGHLFVALVPRVGPSGPPCVLSPSYYPCVFLVRGCWGEGG